MPWWFSTVFPALLLCFLIGLLIGLLLWWLWRRRDQATWERERTTLVGERDELRGEVEVLGLQRERASQLDRELKTARAQTDRIPRLEEQVTALTARADAVPALEAQIDELNGRIALHQRTDDKNRTELVGLRGRAEEAEAELTTLRTKAREAEAELVSLRSKASTAEADMAALHATAANAETELAGLRARAEEADGRLAGLRADHDAEISALRAEHETLVGDYDGRIISLMANAERAEGLGAELANVRGQAEQAEERMAALRSGHEAELAELRAGHHSEITALTTERDRQIAALSTDAERATTLETALANARSQGERANAELASLRSEHDALRADAERAESLDAELAKARSRGAALEDELEKCGRRSAELKASLDAAKGDVEQLRRATEAAEATTAEAAPTAVNALASPATATGPTAARTVVRSWRVGTTKLGTPGAGHSDDLKVVNGIGPVMERTLHSFGIKTWEQLAAFTAEDVEKVSDAIETFPGRIERDGWVAQAKDLVERFPLTDPYHRPTRKTFLNNSSDDNPWE